MSNVKPQPTTRIEHKLPKTKEGQKGATWTVPLSPAIGLKLTNSESRRDVLGRRPADDDQCQSRRTL